MLASLNQAGIDTVLTREPGGSSGAEEIRSLIVEGDADKWDDLTELLLINAARRTHLVQTIWPKLQAGTWVVCDRFVDSSRAFQGYAGKLGLDLVNSMHRAVAGDFTPDLTIVLDLDPAVSLARTVARGGSEDRFEKKGLAYQQAVRAGFLSVARDSPDSHVLIDAGATIEQVTASMLASINERLGLNLSPVEQA